METLWQLALVNLRAIGKYEAGVVFEYDGEKRVYQGGAWYPSEFEHLSKDMPHLTFNDMFPEDETD